MIKTFFVLWMVAVLGLSACTPRPAPTAALEIPTQTLEQPTATTVAPTRTLASPTPIQLPATPTPAPQGRTLLVTSAADSGRGTLIQALLDAQNGDTITFDPSVFPPDAPVTIFIASELPHIRQGNLTIDASNAGVILDGRDAGGDWLAGLQIVESDANTIRGLQISNFSGPGIAISGDAQYNTIGGDRSIGAGPFGQGNLLSNNNFGIVLSTKGTSLNTITGNLIGTDAKGAETLGNNTGVWITEGAHDNTIGPGNVITQNNGSGIGIDDPETVRNTITRNSIHDNGEPGIYLREGGNKELIAPLIYNFDLTEGFVTGLSCANCAVEIFSDGSDEGAIYEGQIAADGKGTFTFMKGAPLAGASLTATATDPDGNTSEFSPPTQGASQNLSLQVDNLLPIFPLQTKPSNELSDNRIRMDFYSSFMKNDLPNLDREAEKIIASGIKHIQTSLTETEPPISWDFSENDIPPEYDRFIDVLIENGITVNYMLHFWDKAGHPGGEGLTRPRFTTDEQIQYFAEYVRFIVSHFKGRIDYYTIWSEPDYCGDDQIKCVMPQEYIEMARQVIPVIRQEDPQAKIVSAPYVLFWGRDQLFTVLSSDVAKQFDVISWHPIFHVLPGSEIYGNYYYEYPTIIQEIKQTASAHGFQGEYWGMSLGWCSKDLPDSCAQLWAREALETDLLAAKYFARGMVMELGMDVGVGLGGDWYNKPWSYPTIRNLNTVMAGNKLLDIAVEIESDVTHLTSYGFSLPNGDRLFAVWNDNVAVDYDSGIPSTITFPATSAQKVIGIDVLHGFEQELIIEMEGGNLVIRDFLIKDYPIILRLID